VKKRGMTVNQSPRLTVKEWARKNPLAAAKAALCIILQFAAGSALGGVIFFGPLNLGWSIVTLAGAFLAGLLFAALTARQKLYAVTGPPDKARKWGQAVKRGSLVLALSIGALVTVQLYLAGAIPVPFLSRTAEFNRLCRTLELHYPYSDDKGIDLSELKERYAPLIAAAANDAAYFKAIRSMLAELNDAHTALVTPSLEEIYMLGSVRMIGEKAVVTRVREDIDAAGLERGAVITARDGLTVAEYLAALEPWQISGSTERQRLQKGYLNLMTAAHGETFELTYLDARGNSCRVQLTGAPPEASSSNSGPAQGGSGPVIEGKRLASGIGYINIPTFSSGGRDLVAEFDRALDALMDTPALILDLRLNGGGSTANSDRIAGRFFDKPFVYGCEYYTVPLPQRGWAREYRYRVTPRGENYAGPVVLLTDVFTVSTAENFVTAMKDSQRALLAGRPTAGSSGNPMSFNFRGGYARYSTGDFRRNDGRPIEGIGFEPHIPVEWTVEDVINGRDPDIAAAEDCLLNHIR
jgi:carboxyl-terminal processing protease